MGKQNVKKNVKEHETNIDKFKASWNEALRDAEVKLREAQRQVMDWKAVIRVCRERVARRAPWPGSATQN